MVKHLVYISINMFKISYFPPALSSGCADTMSEGHSSTALWRSLAPKLPGRTWRGRRGPRAEKSPRAEGLEEVGRGPRRKVFGS